MPGKCVVCGKASAGVWTLSSPEASTAPVPLCRRHAEPLEEALAASLAALEPPSKARVARFDQPTA